MDSLDPANVALISGLIVGIATGLSLIIVWFTIQLFNSLHAPRLASTVNSRAAARNNRPANRSGTHHGEDRKGNV